MLNYVQKYVKFIIEDFRLILLRNFFLELVKFMFSSFGINGRVGLLSFVFVVGVFLDDNKFEMLVNLLKYFFQSSFDDLFIVMIDVLFNEIRSDNMDLNRWLLVVDMCLEFGLLGIGVEILFILIIREVLNKVFIVFSMDYIF